MCDMSIKMLMLLEKLISFKSTKNVKTFSTYMIHLFQFSYTEYHCQCQIFVTVYHHHHHLYLFR